MRDSDVRAAVRKALEADHANDPHTRIVEEMGVWSGSVRIDMAVINGELAGFELKSDRDTLERLPFQAELYSRVFDRLFLVVGSKHAEKANHKIPDWWGLTVATASDEGISLNEVRKSEVNPCRDPYLIAQLLWKEEAMSVLDTHGLLKGWRTKRVKQLHERLATELPLDTLRLEVRTALKARTGWLGQHEAANFDVTVDADLNPAF